MGAGNDHCGMVLRQYRLLERIGEGGMGIVYAAQHVRLRRRAAVKVLSPDLCRNPKLLKRFFVEAQIVASLQHPHVVDVIDLGEDDPPCIVMELLSGHVLSSVIAEAGRLPIIRAARIAVQVLGALGAAHKSGIVHRDLKPANVFLASDEARTDFVKILDFGIAKLTDGASYGLSSTAAGTLMGTPRYMAPEQIEGHSLDGRVDVYAAGIILFEMLTGRPPFDAPTLASLFSKHLLEPPPPLRASLPGAPADLESFVARCLAKRREDRYAGAEEARAALQSIAETLRDAAPDADELPTRPHPLVPEFSVSTLREAAGETSMSRRPQRSRRLQAVVAIVASAVVAAGMVYLLAGGLGRDDRPSSVPSPPAAATSAPLAAPVTLDAGPSGRSVAAVDAAPAPASAGSETPAPAAVTVTPVPEPINPPKTEPPRPRPATKTRTRTRTKSAPRARPSPPPSVEDDGYLDI